MFFETAKTTSLPEETTEVTEISEVTSVSEMTEDVPSTTEVAFEVTETAEKRGRSHGGGQEAQVDR